MGRFADFGSFVQGIPINANSGYVILSIDELSVAQVPHSIILMIRDNNFFELFKVGWLSAGLAILDINSEHSLIIVSNYGKTLELIDSNKLEGRIDEKFTAENKINKRGPLRCIRTIGQHVYAVGGDRQCYRRDSSNIWIDIASSCRPPIEDNTVYGFESIDGFSEKEIYGVGWRGEIWRFDGERWAKLDSPTNMLLTEICCTGDGFVYIGGIEGLLIRGRNTVWEIVDTGGLINDIWGIRWFKGSLFISDMKGIYTLTDAGIEPIDLELNDLASFYKLNITGDALWSIGEKNIASFEGVHWKQID
ncbi:MAG: hypothetical protein ABL919_11960 [Methylococcales bacterium]|nr:hypothetical protein [Methylococcaceae bacterium]